MRQKGRRAAITALNGDSSLIWAGGGIIIFVFAFLQVLCRLLNLKNWNTVCVCSVCATDLWRNCEPRIIHNNFFRNYFLSVSASSISCVAAITSNNRLSGFVYSWRCGPSLCFLSKAVFPKASFRCASRQSRHKHVAKHSLLSVMVIVLFFAQRSPSHWSSESDQESSNKMSKWQMERHCQDILIYRQHGKLHTAKCVSSVLLPPSSNINVVY